jgi:hypothetical protein
MSECWREFDVAVGRWRLGELMAERLPAAAVKALSAGCDSPSLARLAGMDSAGWSEVEPEFARVLEERGWALPDESEALKLVANDAVQRMVAGEVAPEVATERLRRLSMKALDGPQWEDLGVFHHLALDWEVAEGARLEHQAALREDMLREGRELMTRGGVRLS